MASAAPSVENTFSAACRPPVNAFSVTASALPRPTSSTRSAATPFRPRSSRVEPGLPVMSPDFSACVISPAPSRAWAACESFLFSNTATATQPVFADAMLFLVSNAFMLKSI